MRNKSFFTREKVIYFEIQEILFSDFFLNCCKSIGAIMYN